MTEYPANAHAVMKTALKEVEPACWPSPVHRGGPKPGCPIAHQVAIALWCAGMFEDAGAARPEERARVRALVQGWIDEGGRMFAADAARLETFARAAQTERPPRKGPASALVMLSLAAAAVHSAARGKRMGGVSSVVMRTARQLAPARHADFCAALDRRLVVGEAQAAITRYAPAGTLVRDVLWRGAVKGKARHFVVVTDEGLGLLTKLRRRWGWFAGDREEVLGTVPDAYFEEATQAVYRFG